MCSSYPNHKQRVSGPDSKHNFTMRDGTKCAQATDIAPYNAGTKDRVPWDDTYQWVQLSGIVMAEAHKLGLSIRWGGNWDGDYILLHDQKFQDLGHYELHW